MKNLEHTRIGDITEYEFAIFCLKHGIAISKPMTNDLPYDFIIDIQGKLLRIQVKTGYSGKTKDTFVFNTKSTSKNFSEINTKYYFGLIDGFITCYQKIPNKFFYIPIEEVPKGAMTLYYGDTPDSRQHLVYNYDFEKMCDTDVMVA